MLQSSGRDARGAGRRSSRLTSFASATPLERSELEIAAQRATGVDGVLGIRYRRRGQIPNFVAMPETVTVAADEIIRCRQRPPEPERGSLRIVVQRGQVTGIALRDCGCGCAGCTGGAICPCENVHGPWRIFNPSALEAIAYRVGDFGSFRHELVRHLEGEQQLAAWRPSADGDLALQIVDWFAIVADILTFYSERIANEAYLGTAALPDSVQRLVGLLGYRPRPGIGAVGTLGVIAYGPGPIVVPDRFAIASKARPGIDSQTFELTTGTTFTTPTSVPGPPPDDVDTVLTPGAHPPGRRREPASRPHDQLIVRGGVLVKGKVSNVEPGDRLLLIAQAWTDP